MSGTVDANILWPQSASLNGLPSIPSQPGNLADIIPSSTAGVESKISDNETRRSDIDATESDYSGAIDLSSVQSAALTPPSISASVGDVSHITFTYLPQTRWFSAATITIGTDVDVSGIRTVLSAISCICMVLYGASIVRRAFAD